MRGCSLFRNKEGTLTTAKAATPQDLCDRLDAIIEERSVLKHPFYQTWQKGELTLDALRGYACQYYQHVLAFPKYVSGTHANCDDLADRQELLENLREEEEGPNNHPELWLRFGEALGLTREDMINAQPLPETVALDDTYRRITKDAPFVSGISALYAYESQVPAVAATKMDGLKQFYGITDPQQLKFFIVHKSLDVEHSKVTRNMVARSAQSEDQQALAVEAVAQGAGALLGFLDGCYREYIAA
jgi:pyrroloquinoline-quinone synthase